MSFFCWLTLDIKSATTQPSTKYVQKPAGRQAVVLPSMFHQTRVMETKFRGNSGYWTADFLNNIAWNWKKKDTNTFWLIFECNTKNKWGRNLGLCWDQSVCEWRRLAQSFIHSSIRSHGPDSLMHWSPHLLRWGLVSLKTLWRSRHLSACSGKRYTQKKRSHK